MGFLIIISLMILCLFKVKSKIKIFIVWVLCCFLPFVGFVYDGESSKLHYTYEMGSKEVLRVWFYIVFTSFLWALLMLVVAFSVYFTIKWLNK